MENQIFGIFIFVLCAFIFYKSFIEYKRENFELSLYLIVFAGAILRIYTSLDFYLHEWDERYHALVAKNLIDNPFKPMLYQYPILDYDYKNWAGNHIWVHKQPVPLYSMALSMFVFGKNVIALRFPSIILSTLAIIGTFKIGKILFTKKVGLIGAFLFSINGFIIELTAGRIATDHIDVYFLSFVTFAIYYLLKHSKNRHWKYLFLGGLFTGLAILSKWLPALIVLPVWTIASYKKNKLATLFKDLLFFLFLVALIVLPWQFYIFSTFPIEANWEAFYNRKHIFEALGPHSHPFYYHFDKMRIIFGELVYLPFIWLIYSCIFGNHDRKKWIILVWILIPYLFFTIVKTKMPGYIMITAPAVFLMIAIFHQFLLSIRSKSKYLINVIIALLFLLPIRYSIERIKPFSNFSRNAKWIPKMQELNNRHQKDLKVIFNCKYPIETMFHTDFIAYESLPSINKLIELESKNYTIFLDNWQDIPASKANLSYVNYVEITGNRIK